MLRHTLCLENVPHLTCYNLDVHDPITIIFGRSVNEKVRSDDALFTHITYLVLQHLTCERGKPEDSALVHCACNTVQLLERFRRHFSGTVPPTTAPSWTHWLQDLKSHTAAYESWVKKIEEIKQRLVEFWHLTEKCNFCVVPFCQVVQKHKLVEVA